MTQRADADRSTPNWPSPAALGAAFAWAPAVDVVVEIVRVRRHTAGLGALIIGLALVVARYGIARYAFLGRGPKRVAIRLALLTFAVAVLPRLFWLLPLSIGVTRASVATLLSNAAFVPAAAALYAAVLPAFVFRGKVSFAALWAALPQVALSYFGLWEADWKVGFVGVEWKARIVAGIVVPFIGALVAELRTWVGRAPSLTALRARAPWPALVAWLVFPLGVLPLSFLASLPAIYTPDPFIVASARARDGTRLLVTQVPDDPTDVFLNVRHPSGPWARYRIAYGESPWAGRIDIVPNDHFALISAYDVLAAKLDLDTDTLEKVAPLTGFVGTGKQVDDPICDPLMYDPVGAHVQCRTPEAQDQKPN